MNIRVKDKVKEKNSFKKLFCIVMGVNVIALVGATPILAEEDNAVQVDTQKAPDPRYNIAAGIGILTIIGLDMRLLIRESQSPWLFSLRYLNTKDDFINEAVAGLPEDASDKLYTKRVGPEVYYLFSPYNNYSFYVGGGLIATTKKLTCHNESDSISNKRLFFGGGLHRQWTSGFGYQFGILLSPNNVSTLKTTFCQNDEGGDFDINISLLFGF